jgi:hypothetical protein
VTVIDLGERLKEQGQKQVEEHNRQWIDWMRMQARFLAEKNGVVSTDDLQDLADWWNRHPGHPNAWGAIFRDAGFARVGYTKSRRPKARCRVISVWKLKENEHGQSNETRERHPK